MAIGESFTSIITHVIRHIIFFILDLLYFYYNTYFNLNIKRNFVKFLWKTYLCEILYDIISDLHLNFP